jgi:hypothetical protein
VDLVPEAPEDVRELAYRAFCSVQGPIDESARSAAARDRIRNIKSPRGIAGLPPRLRALWDWHVENQAGFADLPFDRQRDEFLSIQARGEAPELGIPSQRGRRGHDAFHAAGAPLLAWWEGQGRRVTANLGPDRGSPQPCEAVLFVADEFLRIAERYGDTTLATFDAPDVEFADPEAARLPRRVRHAALNIGFDVAERHVQNRTVNR